MANYVFGPNILENLTTGMYRDSKVIYREYIQNACDQIDIAVRDGLLGANEGEIAIWIDLSNRSISIADNATGVPASEFQRVFGSIADSDKMIGAHKGFRGIGRLCGLAYCRELIFRCSARGEDVESIMICDARKMRQLIMDHNAKKTHYTAEQVLQAVNRFERRKANVDSHFFIVELNDVNEENTELLDFQQVKDYLSFVAPVPYQNTFIYRDEIYSHAKEIGETIDEYYITINGEPVVKKYTTVLKDANGQKYDDIFGVHFKDFYHNGQLMAWMWIGVSTFKKAIPKNNIMRGLRLRKENIQIGGEDALQRFFKEERGNNYFIGEVFAIHKELIPNSQRDYFNENASRLMFEQCLNAYFTEELHKAYYQGSMINSAYRKIDRFDEMQKAFYAKAATGAFVDDAHRKRELQLIDESKKKAESALKQIQKVKINAAGLTSSVIQRVEKERARQALPSGSLSGVDTHQVTSESARQTERRTDKLSRFSKSERKLIARIFSIILAATDSETAEAIIQKIEEGLQ